MSSPEEQLVPPVLPLLPTSSSSESAAAKADLAALLDQWEEARVSGATERLVQVITRWLDLFFVFFFVCSFFFFLKTLELFSCFSSESVS